MTESSAQPPTSPQHVYATTEPNLSHELRTPLTVIQGFLALLGEGLLGSLSTEGERLAKLAIGNADRLMQVTTLLEKDTDKIDILSSQDLLRLQYERQLHYALPQQQLQLAYQPIVRLSDSKVTELEVLLRWQHPVFGAIAPDQFIPLAEKTGLIVPIGLWILETACKQLAHWRQSDPQLFDQVKLSINLSTVQLNQPRLPEQVSQILVATGLKAADLSLEVTESGVMEDSELAHQSLQSLRQQGIQIYIDDFGTGYSCLSRLHELPIDVIKVDRSFVNRMHTLDGAQVIHLITSLAQSLGARVVAEGIETVEQQHQLQRMGCDYGQGYLFQRPLSAERLSLSLAA